jgi:SOS-response transcriptional repressor LexA
MSNDKKKLGLTEKQAKFLQVIQAIYQDNNGYSPSYEELKQLNNMKSKSNVHAYVHALKKRGYIDFIAYSNRSIVVL